VPVDDEPVESVPFEVVIGVKEVDVALHAVTPALSPPMVVESVVTG